MRKKIPTKIKVIRFKTKNPFMRTSEIAKKMGYNRSYVHKVLKESGLFTRIPSGFNSRHVYCAECKELIMTIKRKSRYNEKKAEKTFCSSTCEINHYNIQLTCYYCKEPFMRAKSAVKQGYIKNSYYIYCTIKCKNRDKRKDEDKPSSILKRLNE